MLAGVLSRGKKKRELLLDFHGGDESAAAGHLPGCSLTVVLIDTNNDRWLPHTDRPIP
jgi:hypothetical protein